MSYPETEVLNSLVARVFRAEDITLGEPARGLIARYRGHLLLEDSVAAYDQLAASLAALRHYAPLSRGQGPADCLPGSAQA